MKIIDINAGLGIALKSRRYTDESGLIRYLDGYRIESAVTWNGAADRHPEAGNAEMLAISARSGGRLLPCMLLEPALDSLGLPGEGDVIARLRQSAPAAVRVVNGADPKLWLDKFYAQDILRPLNETRMPLIISGDYGPDLLHALPEMAEAFPDVPLILLRHGLNQFRTIQPLLKYTKSVYFDMSTMLDAGGIEEIVRKFGSERLLFGSGLPQFVPSGALGLLMYTDISEADRENIAHANFERLEGGIRL